MGDQVSDEDREFCHLYGEQCHEYYETLPWERAVPKFETRWMRVRGASKLDWVDAEPHVRAGWELAARLAGAKG